MNASPQKTSKRLPSRYSNKCSFQKNLIIAQLRFCFYVLSFLLLTQEALCLRCFAEQYHFEPLALGENLTLS